MRNKYYVIAISIISVIGLVPSVVKAHCPLCTIGVGTAAIGASWLGISQTSIGIFVGAFAVALGLWVANLIKKQYIPQQKNLVGVFSFLTTVLPLMAIMKDVTSVYISFAGEYGALLNRVYLINLFLIGSIVGAVIMFFSPQISLLVKKQRKGKMIPYQGIIITILLLIFTSLVIEFIV